MPVADTGPSTRNLRVLGFRVKGFRGGGVKGFRV